jgi:hypothetical protein
MANEINIQASLAFQRDVITLQAAGSKSITQSPGTKGILNQATVGTTAVKLIDSAASPIVSIGSIFVKNLDASGGATPTVELSLDGSTQVYATLKPSEFCLIPVNKPSTPTIWAKASAAGVGVLFSAAEI